MIGGTSNNINIEQLRTRSDLQFVNNVSNQSLHLKPSDIANLLPSYEPTALTSLNAIQFIKKIEKLRQIYSLDDRMILIALTSKLQGAAQIWFRTVQDKIESFNEFSSQFKLKSEVDVHEKLTNYILPSNMDLLT